MQRRRARTFAIVAAGLVLAVPATTASAGSSAPEELSARELTLARQTLPDADGWGSAGPGTTGGSAAADDQIHVVASRAELIAALGGDNAGNQNNDTPKIIVVDGVIDGFEGPQGGLLTCDDFADPGYDFDEYLAAYDPAVWGWETDPSGPLEEARERSMRNQEAHTQINVGSNTTLIGRNGATIRRMTLMFNRADNVIVRNITFEDALDCQPRWRPTDGAAGNWNSHFDYISIRRGANFWIDHNTFRTSASDLPEYFGRKYEVYDGQLDITHTADLVTVSSNLFKDHDKLMLIGSTNNPGGGDPGRLNVTIRHNVFDGVGQRAPRVRFGQVDLYNNYYKAAVSAESYEFGYLWGVGVESQIHAENNYIELAGSGVDPSDVIQEWGGTAITEKGTRTDFGPGLAQPISLLDAFNAVNDPQLGADAGWTPVLRSARAVPAAAVPGMVSADAGAGKLR